MPISAFAEATADLAEACGGGGHPLRFCSGHTVPRCGDALTDSMEDYDAAEALEDRKDTVLQIFERDARTRRGVAFRRGCYGAVSGSRDRQQPAHEPTRQCRVQDCADD